MSKRKRATPAGKHTAPARRDQPLAVTRTLDGVLTIKIGVATLAHATLHSEYAYELADEKTGRPGEVMPDTLFKITDPYLFARDVASALTEEAEDGSSLLTKLLDDAARKAIEDGAEHFMGIDEEE